jgi:hypothetical protein
MIINEERLVVRSHWDSVPVRNPYTERDSFARTLRRQERVVSRGQALAFGVTPDALRYRARAGGPWQRLLPGVYLTVTGAPTATQTEIAALLYAGDAGVLTGLAALRHHRMRAPEARVLTVLIPAGHVRRSRDFVTFRPTTRMPATICLYGGVRYTLPARAVADAALELRSFREVRALVADAVQQRRCRLEELQDELAHGPRRGSAWLRRSLAEVTTGIGSVAEGDFGDLIRHSGLPMPVFNAHLYVDKTLIAIADAWWPEAGVAGEVDSRAWHLSPDDWEYTLERHARMSRHGIIVLHFTPGQIRTQPARVVADIKAALASGRARAPLAVRALSTKS